MPVKRFRLVPVNPEEYDDEYNMNLEFFLDESGRPFGKMTSFGSMGGLAARSETEPFFLMADGDMDFGSPPPDYRANAQKGLRTPSQIMLDKPMTIKTAKIGSPFGNFDDLVMIGVSRSLALFLGLAG